jgi:peptidoglycan/LPS O-acetylase OafA/YrhL
MTSDPESRQESSGGNVHVQGHESAAPTVPSDMASAHDRFDVLDGWRAISILLVLATHMLPLGPKWMKLNSTAGPAGMSLFFSLSGFLITTTLLRNRGIASFYIRRLFRIVPLAVVGSSLILLMQAASFAAYPPLWLYYWNYHQGPVPVEHVSHFWSLCVEMHFYLAIGLIVGIFGQRGLLLVVPLALALTAWRLADGVYINIKTHYRADEILAGASLAMVHHDQLGRLGRIAKKVAGTIPLAVGIVLFVAACHPDSGSLQYLRPYLGAAVIGITLFAPGWANRWLRVRLLRYIAEISYALYVIHPASMMGWLGSGDTTARYLKRPLCFAITFALAHVSTFYFERYFTALGKQLANRLELAQAGEVATRRTG